MARIIHVIEAHVWRNERTGQTASTLGACPWHSDMERRDWRKEFIGYTWQLADGTVGLGRKPAATFEDALAIMDRVNAL